MTGILDPEARCLRCPRRQPFDKAPPLGWHLVNGFYGYCPRCQLPSPTLTEALAAAGYTHRPGDMTGRDIVRVSDGAVVGRMKTREAWEWLREQRQGAGEEGATER